MRALFLGLVLLVTSAFTTQLTVSKMPAVTAVTATPSAFSVANTTVTPVSQLGLACDVACPPANASMYLQSPCGGTTYSDTFLFAITNNNSFSSGTLSALFMANYFTAISWSGGVATATTANPHGITPGQQFFVQGVSAGGFNSPWYWIAAAGTTGSTLVWNLSSNPGAGSGGYVLNTAPGTTKRAYTIGVTFGITGVTNNGACLPVTVTAQ